MLKSKLCEILPVGAILLVRKLGEVTGIWDRYEAKHECTGTGRGHRTQDTRHAQGNAGRHATGTDTRHETRTRQAQDTTGSRQTTCTATTHKIEAQGTRHKKQGTRNKAQDTKQAHINHTTGTGTQ
jgi:hypothetical protein